MIQETRNISRPHGEGGISLTDKAKRRGRLSFEILGLFAVCLAVALLLYFFLSFCGIALVEKYCWEKNLILSEEQIYHFDNLIFSVSLLLSVGFFVFLFLVLFGERFAYIRTIMKGVDALQRGELEQRVPIMGNNELTSLAEEINYLSETEQKIKEREKALNEEKEELIRTLSHDIRTPLTSIMAYTELLSAKETCTPEEQREYLSLVQKKTAQIKNLTDILLEGGKRKAEHFEDARLLFAQLICEFEEVLEGEFELKTSFSDCPVFSGSFDVQDMRRIFDNLISNAQKYADPTRPVELAVKKSDGGLVIWQKNATRKLDHPAEGFRMGINSIRRIANSYGGSVNVEQNDTTFEITVILSEF